jgi:hypothetical protein
MRVPKLLSLCLLTACTFSTGSNDREVIDRLDFDMNMTGMNAHAAPAQQVDIALVVNIDEDPNAVPPGEATTNSGRQRYALRARSRVLLPPVPPPPAKYPDVHARLARVLDQDTPEMVQRNQKRQVLFYADSVIEPPFTVTPLAFDSSVPPMSTRAEHTWIRDLPASGELTFPHLFVFENFYDAEIRAEGADIVLDVPTLTPARSACLDAELAKVMKSELAVRVFFQPDSEKIQQAGFQMFAGNTVPTVPIRFKGLTDVLSEYGIEVLVDGARIVVDGSVKASRSAPATPAGVTIPFADWYPIPAAALTACLALS